MNVNELMSMVESLPIGIKKSAVQLTLSFPQAWSIPSR